MIFVPRYLDMLSSLFKRIDSLDNICKGRETPLGLILVYLWTKSFLSAIHDNTVKHTTDNKPFDCMTFVRKS